MKTEILPYVDPPLPESAPEWTRTWCSDSSEPLSLPSYENVTRVFAVAAASGRPDQTEMLLRFPSYSLVVAFCMRPDCDEGHYAAACAVGGGFEHGSGVVALCGHPIGCTTAATDHPVAPATQVTVIGYRAGITPEVMKAIQEGQPYEVVRRMSLHPEYAQRMRAEMN